MSFFVKIKNVQFKKSVVMPLLLA